jgi:hypothetical protein
MHASGIMKNAISIEYGRLKAGGGARVACWVCGAVHAAADGARINRTTIVRICATCRTSDDLEGAIVRKFLGVDGLTQAERRALTTEQIDALIERAGGAEG